MCLVLEKARFECVLSWEKVRLECVLLVLETVRFEGALRSRVRFTSGLAATKGFRGEGIYTGILWITD